MASIDERVVQMSFDNAKFEAGVAKTMTTLTKLNEALKNVGATANFGDIDKAANKVTFTGLTNAIDKLKSKFNFANENQSFSGIEAASSKVTFGPISSAIDSIKNKFSTLTAGPVAAIDTLREKLRFTGADKGLNDIENASNRVKFAGAGAAADNLKTKLRFPGVEGTFSNIEKASGIVKMGGITNAISDVTAHFSSMAVVATAALGTIVSKVTSTGLSLAKSLTVDPLIGGLKEYSTNLNSIQTILANTQFGGSTLKDVNAALLQLNKYSDKTIYNFSQMAKNIGTFTAAGVDLDTSVASIKGIANLAALSGSSAEQASSAMYQLSQAIASGRVSLQDWNSVVNAGMGGATFQRALAQTAQAMGTVADGAVKIDKATGKATINGESFRESITAKPGEESWLTSDVLTSTLEQFTGDLTVAQLKAKGFNDEQIKAIRQTAKTAQDAATQVKTLGQVFDVAKETIGSGWAQTFQTIFGDFEEAKGTFTALSGAINGFINTNANARNKVLGDWKELGGRASLIEGIKNVFEDLGSVIKPISNAFREIFPAKTGQDLFDLTKRFENFTEKLKLSSETADNLKRTFAGFFAVVDIGKQVIGGILGVFGDLLGATSSGSGGFLQLTGTVGDFLVSIDKALKEGKGLTNFFETLGEVLAIPIKLLSELAGALASVFDTSGNTKGISSSMNGMTESLSPLTLALQAAGRAWHNFLDAVSGAKSLLGPLFDELGNIFDNFGDVISSGFDPSSFDKFFQILETTLIGGLLLTFRKAFKKGFKIDFGGTGAIGNLKESLGALTGSLTAMQTNIKAGTILKIALAVTALAGGVTLLSTIDPKRLASAMTAVSVGLGELIGAMAILTKVGGVTTFLTMPFIASSLILLAGAIDILAIAVKVFSKMDWEELAKGLVGVGGALVAVGLGVKAIPPSVALIGPALLPMAVALNILAVAVKIFSTLDWEELAKGLIGVGGALTAVGIGTKAIGPSILLIGPGLIGVAIALNLLAGAVAAFGSMKLSTLAKGLGGIAASLVAIGVSIGLIPPTVALQAAGLVLLGIALTEIAAAVGLMGSLGIGTIAKGLTAIGASLLVLGTGLTFMGGTIPGTIALMGAATALAVLTPVIGALGTMKWTTIAKGIGAIAITLGVLAIAGIAAAPGLSALGIALIPLAGAVTLMGSGVYLLSSGIAKLGVQGPKNIAAVVAALTAMVAILPKVVINFIKGLVDIAESIAGLAPKIVDSMVKIIEMLLDVVIESAPKMAEAVTALMTAFLKVIDDNAPNIIESGFKLLLAFLSGINDHIQEVVTQVGEIIIKFLTTLAANIPRIIAAGANLLVQFLEGLASNFPKVIAAGADAIVKFLQGVASNIGKVVAAAVNIVVEFVEAIAANVGKVVRAGADLIINVLEGIGNNVKRVAKAAVDMVGDFFDAAVHAALDLTDAGAKAVLNFLNGTADAIRKYSPQFGAAGRNIASAIIQGALSGIDELGGQIPSKLAGIAGNAIKSFGKKLGIGSPSKEFMKLGGYMMEGLVIGIDSTVPHVTRSLENSADGMIETMSDSLRAVPDILDGLIDMDPVITPVLDLSNIQRDAKALGDLSNVIPITAAASYNQAASISAAQEASQTVQDAPAETPVQQVNFEQNNYSPKALSETEIYRQTNNQLSQAKSALGIPS